MKDNEVQVDIIKVDIDTGRARFLGKATLRRIPVAGEYLIWDDELWRVEDILHKTNGPLDEVYVVEGTPSDENKLGSPPQQ